MDLSTGSITRIKDIKSTEQAFFHRLGRVNYAEARNMVMASNGCGDSISISLAVVDDVFTYLGGKKELSTAVVSSKMREIITQLSNSTNV